MEIRKVEKNIANYPKKNEIEKSEIKRATPKKWVFSGMFLSLVYLTDGRVCAEGLGGLKVEDISYVGAYLGIAQVVSFCLLIAAIVDILYTKIRAKIKGLERKISRKQKIFMTISLVLLALSFTAEIIHDLWYESLFLYD